MYNTLIYLYYLLLTGNWHSIIRIYTTLCVWDTGCPYRDCAAAVLRQVSGLHVAVLREWRIISTDSTIFKTSNISEANNLT